MKISLRDASHFCQAIFAPHQRDLVTYLQALSSLSLTRSGGSSSEIGNRPVQSYLPVPFCKQTGEIALRTTSIPSALLFLRILISLRRRTLSSFGYLAAKRGRRYRASQTALSASSTLFALDTLLLQCSENFIAIMPGNAHDEAWEDDAVFVESDDAGEEHGPIQPLEPHVVDRMRNWLFPTMYKAVSSPFGKYLAARAPETGQWLFDSPSYRDWHDGEDNSLLWIKGTSRPVIQ